MKTTSSAARVAAPLLLFLLLAAVPPAAQESAMVGPGGLTPSDVYQHGRRVMSEIELIRRAEGVSEEPRDPGTQVNKLPIHAYQKAVELMDKVGRYQDSLGLAPMEVANLPFAQLTPQVVFDAVDAVLENLREIKAELGIEEEIDEPPFEEGKTPTDVYELLWRASYMLDGLTEAIQPSDVYARQQQAVNDLLTVSEELDTDLSTSAERFSDKTPKDVLMENYVNMYRLARVQRTLGMDPFHVPPLPGGEITPSNVYDTAGTLIGELHRIKRHLEITDPTPPLVNVDGKTPNDVYGLAKMLQAGLAETLDAAEAADL